MTPIPLWEVMVYVGIGALAIQLARLLYDTLFKRRSETDRLREALSVARRWIYEGEPEMGWNIDRLDQILKDAR